MDINVDENILFDDTGEWVDQEFGDIDFGDQRLNKRFIKIVKTFISNPSASINEACENWKEAKGCYRFFSNEKIDEKVILDCHRRFHAKTIKNEDFILVAHDTTTFNYTGHSKKKGEWGEVGNNTHKCLATKGIHLHASLGLSPSGLPLALLDYTSWMRRPEIRAESEEKENDRWQLNIQNVTEALAGKTNVIHLADREADQNDIFYEILGYNQHFIIRSKHNRNLIIQDEKEHLKLHDFIAAQPIEGTIKISIPIKEGKRGKKKARGYAANGEYFREVKMGIQYSEVVLEEGRRSGGGLDKLELNVVRVFEENPELKIGEDPLEWILLTTLKVASLEDAYAIANLYAKRWRIETFFKIIKSGFKVEECRLDNPEKIRRYIVTNLITALRVFWMTMVSRETPNAPCTQILSDSEWKTLFCRLTGKTSYPVKVPTINEAIRWIAQLGGFLSRKSDKDPGSVYIWRGFRKLKDMMIVWKVFNK